MSKNNKQLPILESLFNSKSRVKILKFLFRNYPVTVGIRDLAKRIQEPYQIVQKEIKDLEKINLVKKG